MTSPGFFVRRKNPICFLWFGRSPHFASSGGCPISAPAAWLGSKAVPEAGQRKHEEGFLQPHRDANSLSPWLLLQGLGFTNQPSLRSLRPEVTFRILVSKGHSGTRGMKKPHTRFGSSFRAGIYLWPGRGWPLLLCCPSQGSRLGGGGSSLFWNEERWVLQLLEAR